MGTREGPTSLLRSIAAHKGIAFRDDRGPVTSATTTPANQRLSFLDWRGSGPPLLLLHGGALTAHTWDFVCMELAEFHCVALDLRGHGDSAYAEDYTIQASVDDVAVLADALQWSRLHIAGMSLGGNVAFHFAAQHPARVSSLTMVDVGPGVNFEATSAMRTFFAQAQHVQSLAEIVESVMASRPHHNRDVVEYRYSHLMRPMPDGTWRWKQDRRRPHDYEHILGKIAEMTALAPKIHCPVLIARGGRSSFFSADRAAAFAAMFPDGQWTEIPHAGHNIQEDNPKVLAEAIRERLLPRK